LQWKTQSWEVTNDVKEGDAYQSEWRTWTQCDYLAKFGSNGNDWLSGLETQCWCEPTPKYVPQKCADENGDCACEGNVYYTPGKGEDDIMLNFNSAMALTDQWTINFVNSTNSVKCEHATFEDVDPLPGNKKQCFCDDKKERTSSNSVETIKEYWRNEKIQEELKKKKREDRIKREAEEKRLAEEEK
jgi:hypothetical protein